MPSAACHQHPPKPERCWDLVSGSWAFVQEDALGVPSRWVGRGAVAGRGQGRTGSRSPQPQRGAPPALSGDARPSVCRWRAGLAQGLRLRGFPGLSSPVPGRPGLSWKGARKLTRNRQRVVFSSRFGHIPRGCGTVPYTVLLSGFSVLALGPPLYPQPEQQAGLHPVHTPAGSGVLGS